MCGTSGLRGLSGLCREAGGDTIFGMATTEIEFVFEPDPDGGYHAYAPELPGLHTQGETLDEAVSNAEEALALYVEGLLEEGGSLDMGVVRRTLSFPA
jgi:predicted RNase H-like HicB family nuclease